VAAQAPEDAAPIQILSLENVMKKSILLAFLLGVAALAGCAHRNDITDDIAAVAVAAPSALA
jgi:hypothetical protein